MIESITSFDFRVLDWIQENLRCAFLDFTMPKITALGNAGIFFIICALAMLFFKKTRKTGIGVAFALILGLVVCNLTLKPLIARARPYDEMESLGRIIELLIPKDREIYAFPSGHTIAAFEFSTVIMIHDRKWGAAATVLAFLIAFSRIYLYMHHPTDVFASILLGVINGILGVLLADLAYKIAGRIREKRSAKR